MSTLLALVILLIVAIDAALIWAWLRTRRLAREAEAAVPRAGQMQAVTGGAIHYVESGPEGAPPVVLIHGLGGQLQHMTYGLAPLLARDFRVIALDRPGCGWSERDGEGRASLAEQARMIAEFLEARGTGPATVVGHSLGGAVALALALNHPERVAALALLCPLTHPEPATPPVFRGLDVRTPGFRKFLAHTVSAPMAVKMAETTLNTVFAPEPWPKDFLTRGGGALGLRPKGYIAASEDLAAATPGVAALVPRYAELKAPGGVLFGAEDALLAPRRHGEALAEAAPGIIAETLPGRGHMIPITAPEDCAGFVRRMAAQARLAPSP